MTPPDTAQGTAAASSDRDPAASPRDAGLPALDRPGRGAGTAAQGTDSAHPMVPARMRAGGTDQVPAKLPRRPRPPQVAGDGGPVGPAAPKDSRASEAPVPPARIRQRHRVLLISFVLLVILPSIGVVWYMVERAQDRYASAASFFVHREDTTPSVETLFGLPSLGATSGTPDAEVLYQFIQSQQIVERADAALDLRAHYSAPHDIDPVFALAPDATLEDLLGYWERIVTIVYDPDAGLISLEVTAFDPSYAQALAQEILEASAQLIEDLSQIARDDIITQSQRDLTLAEERLRAARVEVAEFRNSSQFIDPTAVVAGAEGVITALEQRLAEELINRDALTGTTTRPDDPRIERADRTITAIRERIAAERTTMGDEDATAVGRYEELLSDRTFAEQAYIAALGAFDAAVAEARRKSRYLATHIPPTLADTAIYPQRTTMSLLGFGLLFVVWSVFGLVFYSLKDRN